jgi:hypothetical protein
MTLKATFERACNENLPQVLCLSAAQAIANGIGTLITVQVPTEQIREFVDECLRVGEIACATSRGDRSVDENVKALADALRPPLKIV